MFPLLFSLLWGLTLFGVGHFTAHWVTIRYPVLATLCQNFVIMCEFSYIRTWLKIRKLLGCKKKKEKKKRDPEPEPTVIPTAIPHGSTNEEVGNMINSVQNMMQTLFQKIRHEIQEDSQVKSPQSVPHSSSPLPTQIHRRGPRRTLKKPSSQFLDDSKDVPSDGQKKKE